MLSIQSGHNTRWKFRPHATQRQALCSTSTARRTSHMRVKESKSVHLKRVRKQILEYFNKLHTAHLNARVYSTINLNAPECSIQSNCRLRYVPHSHPKDVTPSYVQLSGYDDTSCLKTFHPELV